MTDSNLDAIGFWSPKALASKLFSLRATLTSPPSPYGQVIASSSYQHTLVLINSQIFVLGLFGDWDTYGAWRVGGLRSVRNLVWHIAAVIADPHAVRYVFLWPCQMYTSDIVLSVEELSAGRGKAPASTVQRQLDGSAGITQKTSLMCGGVWVIDNKKVI